MRARDVDGLGRACDVLFTGRFLPFIKQHHMTYGDKVWTKHMS